MRRGRVAAALRMGCAVLALPAFSVAGEPPFHGTIFIHPGILTSADPSTHVKTVDAGRGMRRMFDRRADAMVEREAWLFTASFSDSKDIEMQVNPEFATLADARRLADRFAPVIGRLPRCLREDVDTVWIHDGMQPFGGGNRNLLIHVKQADAYEKDGILEETLVHEACHTSLDDTHAKAPGWIEACRKDGGFISTYARDHRWREDVAESFLPYLAARVRPDRIPDKLRRRIEDAIPARLDYFDALHPDLRPMVRRNP